MAEKVYLDSDAFNTCIDTMEEKCDEIELDALNFYYSSQSDAMDKLISTYESLTNAIDAYKEILDNDIKVLRKVDLSMLEQDEKAGSDVESKLK